MKPLVWSTAGFFAFVAALTTLSVWALSGPSKWDDAVALRICRDGTPILRKKDGSVWARRSAVVAYRVENEQTVCP